MRTPSARLNERQQEIRLRGAVKRVLQTAALNNMTHPVQRLVELIGRRHEDLDRGVLVECEEIGVEWLVSQLLHAARIPILTTDNGSAFALPLVTVPKLSDRPEDLGIILLEGLRKIARDLGLDIRSIRRHNLYAIAFLCANSDGVPNSISPRANFDDLHKLLRIAIRQGWRPNHALVRGSSVAKFRIAGRKWEQVNVELHEHPLFKFVAGPKQRVTSHELTDFRLYQKHSVLRSWRAFDLEYMSRVPISVLLTAHLNETFAVYQNRLTADGVVSFGHLPEAVLKIAKKSARPRFRGDHSSLPGRIDMDDALKEIRSRVNHQSESDTFVIEEDGYQLRIDGKSHYFRENSARIFYYALDYQKRGGKTMNIIHLAQKLFPNREQEPLKKFFGNDELYGILFEKCNGRNGIRLRRLPTHDLRDKMGLLAGRKFDKQVIP